MAGRRSGDGREKEGGEDGMYEGGGDHEADEGKGESSDGVEDDESAG
jgi:hypothetical protein